MVDLPGHSVAITCTCIMKLECFDKIGGLGKHNFENKFLEKVFWFLEEIIILNEIGR